MCSIESLMLLTFSLLRSSLFVLRHALSLAYNGISQLHWES